MENKAFVERFLLSFSIIGVIFFLFFFVVRQDLPVLQAKSLVEYAKKQRGTKIRVLIFSRKNDPQSLRKQYKEVFSSGKFNIISWKTIYDQRGKFVCAEIYYLYK